MHDEQPSQTALMAAGGRAAHLLVDQEPHLFHDTVALRLLGERGEEVVGYHRAYGDHIVLAGTRAQVTARSAYAERHLAARIGEGVAQYVILGAGLDTFAYRTTPAAGPAIYEVDHPATQAWKRALLAAAGLAPPPGLAFTGVDFETDDLVQRLVADGFDPGRPAVVSWLGVCMYLTREALDATLAALGGLAPGTELIAEYALPPELRDARGAEYAAFALPAAEERGEPWLSFFTPGELSALLERHGLRTVEHVRQADAVDPALWARKDALRPADLCRLVRAVVARP
ncbi:class I SAM-dependent methyltransferase [Thermoactinospora rubra]|uniref:class I SAM-dependent methyltransferase n=1 Tax=Thermoactinospora rubra TaxID=1088767 RepID=UPI000A111286|nr:SAM-dependent methyltransferase [Thermoactinospora rubra]